MSDLLKSILNSIYIRGKILPHGPLLLNLLTGWYYQTATAEEPMIFLIECELKRSGNKYGFFGEITKLSIRECAPNPQLTDVMSDWTKEGWNPDTETSYKITRFKSSQQPQILQSLACLCTHLRSTQDPDDGFAGELYAHFADRIEGFVGKRNEKYLQALEMKILI
jgi:hypothetical protein